MLLGEASEATRPRNSHIDDKRNLFRALRANADLTALLDDKENTTVVLSATNYNQMAGTLLEDPTQDLTKTAELKTTLLPQDVHTS